MKDSTSVLEANLDYAERMVKSGFSTPAQAAQSCGVCLQDLQERLANPPAAHAVPVRKPLRFEP